MDDHAERSGSVNIIVLTGVSGSGKTLVGRLLADSLGWPFYDGDEFQPEGNLAKMSQGFALTDADRAPWLQALRELLSGLVARHGHAVLACSLLKADYRNHVLGGLPGIRLAHLKGPYGLLEARLQSRRGHFFKSGLLASQFEILEEPDAPAFEVDREPSAIVADIRRVLGV